MVLSEFELIERFFRRPARSAVLGVGDDAALLAPQPGCELAVSVDMLVEGRHFFADVDPEALGHKSARGQPLGHGGDGRDAALGAAWPGRCPTPIRVARGVRARILCAGGRAPGRPRRRRHDARSAQSVRHDPRRGARRTGVATQRRTAPATTSTFRGRSATPRSRSPSIAGRIALDASEIVAAMQARLERPTPRVALGEALRGIAHAAIDVSDGLVGDLGHVLARRRLARDRSLPALPRAAAFAIGRSVTKGAPSHWNACSPVATTTSSASPRRRHRARASR